MRYGEAVEAMEQENEVLHVLLSEYRAKHKECVDLTGHPDAMKSQRKDWRCELCKRADELTHPPTITGCTLGAK